MYKLIWVARDQIANIHWIIEKAREFQKNISFTDYAKAFHYVDHNKLRKILKGMEVADHFTCLLKSLHVGQKLHLESDPEQLKDWKLGEEHDKVYIVTLVIELVCRMHHYICWTG